MSCFDLKDNVRLRKDSFRSDEDESKSCLGCNGRKRRIMGEGVEGGYKRREHADEGWMNDRHEA